MPWPGPTVCKANVKTAWQHYRYRSSTRTADQRLLLPAAPNLLQQPDKTAKASPTSLVQRSLGNVISSRQHQLDGNQSVQAARTKPLQVESDKLEANLLQFSTQMTMEIRSQQSRKIVEGNLQSRQIAAVVSDTDCRESVLAQEGF